MVSPWLLNVNKCSINGSFFTINVWLKRSLPSLAYIGLCSLFLILTFEFLPINPFRIDLGLPAGIRYEYLHILPVLLSFILIIPVLYVMFRPRQLDSWVDLHPLEDSWSFKRVLLVNVYYTFLICLFRTLDYQYRTFHRYRATII